MSFCTKCGRQLADGEVCNCQTVAQPQQSQFVQQPQGQPMGQPQSQPQGQFNGQQMGGNVQFSNQQQQQGQFTGQPMGQPVYTQPKQTSPIFQDIANLVKGLLKSPVSSVSYYVNNASAATSCIVIAIIALLAGFRELIYVAYYNAKHPLSSLYEGAEIFTSFLTEVVLVIGAAAVFALMIMLLVNAFEKDHKITYVQALAVASLVNIVYYPVAIVTTVIKMIPVAFFSYLASWMNSFANGVSYALVFIGIKSVERDDNHMPIVYGAALCAVAVISTIINLIF